MPGSNKWRCPYTFGYIGFIWLAYVVNIIVSLDLVLATSDNDQSFWCILLQINVLFSVLYKIASDQICDVSRFRFVQRPRGPSYLKKRSDALVHK